MKRVIVVLFLFCLCLILTTACNQNMENSTLKDHPINDQLMDNQLPVSERLVEVNDLVHYRLNLTDVLSMGIEAGHNEKSKALDDKESRNYLKSVKAGDDEAQEVVFADRETGEEVSQDEIDGEIEKIYVWGNYTFLKYVPIGSAEQPDNQHLDSDGIPVFYKKGYETNLNEDGVFDTTVYLTESQSFVIDNTTGYIYSIPNGYSIGFNDSNVPYILVNYEITYCIVSVDSDDNLILSSFDEEIPISIGIKYVESDKYGQFYILNELLDDEIDDEKQFYFYDNESLILETTEGEMVHIPLPLGSPGENLTKIELFGDDFEKKQIDEAKIYSFMKTNQPDWYNPSTEMYELDYDFDYIKDGYVYYLSTDNQNNRNYYRMNANDLSVDCITILDNNETCWTFPDFKIVVLAEIDETNKLFSIDVLDLFDDDNWDGSSYVDYYDEDNLILDNVTSASRYPDPMVVTFHAMQYVVLETTTYMGITQVTKSRTDDYIVIYNEETGKMEAILAGSDFSKTGTKRIVFQPLNKE